MKTKKKRKKKEKIIESPTRMEFVKMNPIHNIQKRSLKQITRETNNIVQQQSMNEKEKKRNQKKEEKQKKSRLSKWSRGRLHCDGKDRSIVREESP